MRKLDLCEVKDLYGKRCIYTTPDGRFFVVNKFDKNEPKFRFIIPKEFEFDKNGDPIDPLKLVYDEEMSRNMTINWKGVVNGIIFGKFWNTNSTDCFMPKNPLDAEHLLVAVRWQGRDRKSQKGYARQNGALRYRNIRAVTGDCGWDYWIIPVDSCLIGDRGSYFRSKHAEMRHQAIADTMAAEDKSAKQKDRLLPRLIEVRDRLTAIRMISDFGFRYFDFGDDVYFKYGQRRYLYNIENVAYFENYVLDLENRDKIY